MALPIPKKAFFAYNLMYNNLCNMAASMALLEGNEEEFLFHLSAVARENDYEVKPFMLSLYHLSKGHDKTAAKFYEHYLQCRQENRHIKVIMTHLFATSGTEVGSDALYESAAQFKNPAVIKLLGDLGIWGDQIH